MEPDVVGRLSLLSTASLLWALEKFGYGRLLLEIDPGADDVLASSGTISAMDAVGSEPASFTLIGNVSTSLPFLRRWEDRTASLVCGSITFGFDDREDLWTLFDSLFARWRLSLGRSSTPSSWSWRGIVEVRMIVWPSAPNERRMLVAIYRTPPVRSCLQPSAP